MNPNVKATASYIPGTTAWTMAVFEAADVPEGTQVQPVQKPVPVCMHDDKTHGYDYVQCLDCGYFHPDTDNDWGIAAGKWFKSRAEANFYKENGRLPSEAAPVAMPAANMQMFQEECAMATKALDSGRDAQPVNNVDSSVAAIAYALSDECGDDGILFLTWWNEGEFDKIRREFPTAPEEVFITADPLYNKRPKV